MLIIFDSYVHVHVLQQSINGGFWPGCSVDTETYYCNHAEEFEGRDTDARSNRQTLLGPSGREGCAIGAGQCYLIHRRSISLILIICNWPKCEMFASYTGTPTRQLSVCVKCNKKNCLHLQKMRWNILGIELINFPAVVHWRHRCAARCGRSTRRWAVGQSPGPTRSRISHSHYSHQAPLSTVRINEIFFYNARALPTLQTVYDVK